MKTPTPQPKQEQSTAPAAQGTRHAQSSDVRSQLSDLLPAFYRTKKHTIVDPSSGVQDFLTHELNLNRLNDIHRWLKLAGRPMPPRGLHIQVLKGREITLYEELDMHLCWNESRIFIKPLPRYLLSAPFWEANLICRSDCRCVTVPTDPKIPPSAAKAEQKNRCSRRELHGRALGFLLSYAGLICHESDFEIAKDKHLIPGSISWSSWLSFARSLPIHKSADPGFVNKRFRYGELRLNRLNLIYRLHFFSPGVQASLIRGYYFPYDTYSSFFSPTVGFTFVVFAFVTIVLTAMQVGLGTTYLQQSEAFQRASWGFTVAAIFVALAPLAYMPLMYLVLAVDNLVATVLFRTSRRQSQAVTSAGAWGSKV